MTTPLLVSIDLDDAWAYLRARNVAGWQEAPTVLPLVTGRLLGLLSGAGIGDATVFVVGRDAMQAHGRNAIGTFVAHELEIADHSLEHRGELAGRPSEEIASDLEASRRAIAEVTGRLPIGFRCPSFGASPALAEALRELHYAYDASTLPTPLMPLLRLYHRMSAGTGPNTPTYGTVRTAFGSLRPSMRDGLSVLPITTMPVLRLPFHASYLSALAARSLGMAHRYASAADRLCRLRRVPVSFLLHPTDVLDRDDAPALSFFPGMQVPWTAKRSLLEGVLRRLADGRRVARHADVQGAMAADDATSRPRGRS